MRLFYCSLGVLAFYFSASLLQSCTPIPTDSKAKVKYDITNADPSHGVAWPYDFNRAKDLRDHQMFEEASYIYVNLYPKFKDSVISQAVVMDSEAKAVNPDQGASYYITKCVSNLVLHDPEIFDTKTQTLNNAAMKRLYEWTSDLLNQLASKGIK